MLTAGTPIYAPSLIELDEFPITQEHLFKSVEYKSDGMFLKNRLFFNLLFSLQILKVLDINRFQHQYLAIKL